MFILILGWEKHPNSIFCYTQCRKIKRFSGFLNLGESNKYLLGQTAPGCKENISSLTVAGKYQIQLDRQMISCSCPDSRTPSLFSPPDRVFPQVSVSLSTVSNPSIETSCGAELRLDRSALLFCQFNFLQFYGDLRWDVLSAQRLSTSLLQQPLSRNDVKSISAKIQEEGRLKYTQKKNRWKPQNRAVYLCILCLYPLFPFLFLLFY